MEIDKILFEKVSKIGNINNEEYLRFELYGIVTYAIFSKSLFANNKDIESFLDALNIEHKPYLFKTRNLMISRILSNLRKANKEQILEYKDKIMIYFIDDVKIKDSKKIDKSDGGNNYMKEILERYGRGN